jgi:SAM-dependent methyltransferase
LETAFSARFARTELNCGNVNLRILLLWNSSVQMSYDAIGGAVKCHGCGAEISAEAEMCFHCGIPSPGASTSRLFGAAVSVLQKFNDVPGMGLVRRLVGRESVYVVRARLAHKYIRGSGIEFGALNAPLHVPNDARVRYADLPPEAELRDSYSSETKITSPDILTDVESMDGIADCSIDFVIANHVLEHVENPLRALRAMSRVLRDGGIAFIALPDKRFSFDKRRSVTTLAHIIADDENGPDWSLAQHYDDWSRNVEGLRGAAHDEKVAVLLAKRANIHFHVWDYQAMAEMFAYAAPLPDVDLAVQHSQQNRTEAIWILKKGSRP